MSAEAERGEAADAAAIYKSAIVIDGLMGGVLTPRVIERLARSGVTAINLTAVRIGATLPECLADLATAREIIDRNGAQLRLVLSLDDIRTAKRDGKVGVIIGMQDTEAVGRDIYMLRVLREMGVRIIQITHNRQCNVGTGCVEKDSGLTRFGHALVAEMNRLGIVVDVSHCGPQTTLDAIRASRAPVWCTHSNPSAVCPNPRNKSDDIIKALAAKGGVIGVAAWSPILHRGNRRRPALVDLAVAARHVVRLVGPDHIAIGTDLCDDLTPTPESWNPVYGPSGSFPEVSGNLGNWYGFDTNMAEGLETIDSMPNLAPALARVFPIRVELEKLLGLNALRVLEAAMSGSTY